MRTLVMNPGEPLDELDMEPTLEALDAVLGGYAMHLWDHALPLPTGIYAMVREFDYEGQAEALGVPANFSAEGTGPAAYHGPLVIVAHDSSGEWVDLTDAQVSEAVESVGRHLTRLPAT